jgi:hypothetical protein
MTTTQELVPFSIKGDVRNISANACELVFVIQCDDESIKRAVTEAIASKVLEFIEATKQATEAIQTEPTL